jgi:hypothetical protein
MPRKKRESPNPGLTPPDLLKQIKAEVSDEDVQAVSSKSETKRRSILLKAREARATEDGSRRVFGTPSVPDAGRQSNPEPPAVPNILGVDSEAALSDIVREVMIGESDEGGISYLRKMVIQVALKAAKGEQWAVDWIGNRYEGKPGQAPKRSTSIEEVESTIDQVEVAALNRLTEEDNG